MIARTATDMFFRPDKGAYKRKTAPDLTDTELKNKLCRDNYGRREDCGVCVVNDLCQYGKEYLRRKESGKEKDNEMA